jgi:hypothetical protein
MSNFWTRDKIISLLVAIAAVGTFIFGPGTLGPIILNFIHPKYTAVQSSNLLLKDNTISSSRIGYCVQWQEGQEYQIDISTNGTPVNMFIFNETNFKKFSSNQDYFYNLFVPNIFSYSTPYKPLKDGIYFIVITSVSLPNGAYANNSATVNLSLEEYKTCSDINMTATFS